MRVICFLILFLNFCQINNSSSFKGAISLLGTLQNQSTTSATSTFTVSGSATILGEAIVISLNNTESLTITQSGSFQFSTALSSGTAYSVSVTSTPTGQSCTVTNGSGTISSSVTNISISCIYGNANGLLVGGTIFNQLSLTGNVSTVINSATITGVNGVSTDGTFIYVTSFDNHTILKLDPNTNTLTSLAGSNGVSGITDATGSSARFNNPADLVYLNNSLYITDYSNGSIRKLNLSDNSVTTLTTGFTFPYGITSDGTKLYFTAIGRVVELTLTDNTTSTIVGNGSNGFQDGNAASARFQATSNLMGGITFDGTDLYVADRGNCSIRKVVISSRTVTTPYGNAVGSSSCASTDGTGNTASLYYPDGIISDGTNLYFAEPSKHVVRKITLTNGAVSSFAGLSGTSGFVDGSGTSARFNGPSLLTSDGSSLYISDYTNNAIRKIN